MGRLVLNLFFISLSFISCNSYGKKVLINEKSEVYYKSNGVTEEDAKRLGHFLLSRGYFNASDKRSVQLTKHRDTFIVKMVVDHEYMKAEDTVLAGFKVWQMWIEDSVFNGSQTELLLADTELKNIRNVGEFTDKEKLELNTGNSSEDVSISNN